MTVFGGEEHPTGHFAKKCYRVTKGVIPSDDTLELHIKNRWLDR
jgi:hypothetical protein